MLVTCCVYTLFFNDFKQVTRLHVTNTILSSKKKYIIIRGGCVYAYIRIAKKRVTTCNRNRLNIEHLAMKKYILKQCPDCKMNIRIFKHQGSWVAYNDHENVGPHKCKAVADCKKFLRLSGYYACKLCGRTVRCIEVGQKKWVMDIFDRRHRCDERLLPLKRRFWSGDGSLPNEHPVIDGVPVIIIREREIKTKKDIPKEVKIIKAADWVLTDDDLRILDEALNNN